MQFQFLFEAGYARRWPHRFGQTVPSDRSSRCKCVLAEVGACSGNDQIADCSRTGGGDGRRFCWPGSPIPTRYVGAVPCSDLYTSRQSLNWIRWGILNQWSQFLHYAVNVIASAEIDTDILAASFMTLWSLYIGGGGIAELQLEYCCIIIDSADHEAVHQRFRGFKRTELLRSFLTASVDIYWYMHFHNHTQF